ncbi:MAG TPA: hypothetical protein VKB65_12960 [Myxococcota bacterium]|nr:hypothetical protein [Myxococcota bacterium]
MPATLDLDAALRRFGHERFRPGQREAIETLLHEQQAPLVEQGLDRLALSGAARA